MSKISNIIQSQYAELTQLKIDSVERKNGDFAIVDTLKELIINDYFKSQDNLWEFFDTASDTFVQMMYESIANMMENIADIDLCTIAELRNIATLLNVSDLSLFDVPLSNELIALVDTYSVNREYVLYGRHSTTDIEEVFSITDFSRDNLLHVEQVNSTYLSELVDESFKEMLTVALYDPTSGTGQEHIAVLEQIVPEDHLGSAYMYVVGVRDGTVDRYSDSAHYNALYSSDMIVTAAYYMRNYCIKLLLLRETMKSIAQKNSMLGTQRIIEKMLMEYILKEYSNIEQFGFYVPEVASEAAAVAIGVNNDPFRTWTKFLKSISDLGSLLEIEVVEYYDTTEYLNIAPSSVPYKSATVPITGWYSEPFLNVSGQIEYLDPVIITTGYEDIITSEPAREEGNERYWESELSSEDSNDILELFRRLEVIDDDDDTSVLMEFLDRLYDVHTPAFWNTLPATDYAASSDLAEMQSKYSANSEDSPIAAWANIKAQDFATIAPLPFLWNLVEKMYRTFPKIIQYSISTTADLSTQYENIVDIDGSNGNLYYPDASGTPGMIINSWRQYANEYMSYSSYHESEDNLDDASQENKNAEIDGSFNMLALGDLLNIYNDPVFTASGSYIDASGALAVLDTYYYNLI